MSVPGFPISIFSMKQKKRKAWYTSFLCRFEGKYASKDVNNLWMSVKDTVRYTVLACLCGLGYCRISILLLRAYIFFVNQIHSAISTNFRFLSLSLSLTHSRGWLVNRHNAFEIWKTGLNEINSRNLSIRKLDTISEVMPAIMKEASITWPDGYFSLRTHRFIDISNLTFQWNNFGNH